VYPIEADANGTDLLPVTRDAVSQLAEAVHLFGVDVDQVSWRLALVALNWSLGDQVAQPPKGQQGHGLARVEKEATSNRGMCPQLHGAQEAVRIDRPSLVLRILSRSIRVEAPPER
jgi:hypothetical protein